MEALLSEMNLTAARTAICTAGATAGTGTCARDAPDSRRGRAIVGGQFTAQVREEFLIETREGSLQFTYERLGQLLLGLSKR